MPASGVIVPVAASTGGGGLLHVARAISADDRTVIDLLAGNRVIHGLLVMFVGALTALIALGRTLGPRRAVAPTRESPGDDASASRQ